MITSLRLQNFRSYKDSSFEFGRVVNIIVGPNASGKTNLLEAVLVLARGRSYRASLPQLVKLGKTWARLDGNFADSTRTLKITQTGPEFIVDDKTFKRLPTSINLPVVLFEPNHLQLMSGDPGRRRDWLDGLLENTDPIYKKTIASYRRTLAQRNALLKQSPQQIRSQVFAWDVRLSDLGGSIALARQQIVDQINKKITKPYGHIAGRRQSVSVKYSAQFLPASYSSKMLAKLGANLNLDMARGFTGCGPHREGLLFYLNGQPVSQAGSRGETRSLVLSLKIVEKDFVEAAFNSKPLLLLDDVFSELDGARRRGLVDYLSGYQTIITTTDADSVIGYFGKQHNLIPLG